MIPHTMFGLPIFYASMLTRDDPKVCSTSEYDNDARAVGAKKFKRQKSRRKLAKASRRANRK